LEKEHPEQFRKFLIDLENGIDFSDTFRLSFGADAITKWNEFKAQIIEIEPDPEADPRALRPSVSSEPPLGRMP
jgi:hypothetical protein